MNYDEIAPEYDSIYSGDEFKTENLELSDIIRFSEGRVLDVWCGTGELVSVINPTKREYLWIDPSVWMLREFRFGWFTTICGKVTSISETFEFAIGIYGVMNYMTDSEIYHVQRLSKKWFLMDYKNGYKPKCYGEEIPNRRFDPDKFVDFLVWEWHNYLIYSNYARIR